MQKLVISKHPHSYRLIIFLTFSCIVGVAYLVITSIFIIPSPESISSLQKYSSSPTSLEHIVFGIASNDKAWPSRRRYVSLWWRPNEMKGCVFLETNSTSLQNNNDNVSYNLPPVCVSEDTSRFRYTYRNGLRSAIRVARAVSETVNLNYSNVRWFVFGDDDTVFFPENLVKTLSKYDHGLWYYIGSNSESYIQNKLDSFEMAFGGAGIAISYRLAKVLAKVFDACLDRYPHLYGSDGRIHACITELGVSLTHEPGFHQMDMRGSMFGILASQPLKPLVSLHHFDAMNPIFPEMTTIGAVEHLFEAAAVDSHRLLQRTVCYDRWFSWTISVSWGYAVQIFTHNLFLPDALRTQETHTPWRKGGGINDLYVIDGLGYDADPCRRPVVFYMRNVSISSSGRNGGIMSSYRMMTLENCTVDRFSPRKFEEIRVFSRKQELDHKQLQAPRRHCCDVLPTSAGSIMEINIRECCEEELIYMH